MRITHVITGLEDGGAEAVLYQLCTQEKENHHTVISLMGEGKYGPMLRKAGVAVHSLNQSRGSFRPSAALRLWRLFRVLQPDLVQTWMYHADFIGGIIARLAGIGSVVWGIHNTTLERGKSSKVTIAISQALAYLSYLVPSHIVLCAQRAFQVHELLGYNKNRMHVISNGYDITKFSPNMGARKALRTEWEIAPSTHLIGMVGRFDPHKDHANLLKALTYLHKLRINFICILVGTGLDPDNELLMPELKRLGLQGLVRLMGRRDDIPDVMSALDLHVLSSSAEAFPNVLAEAMACGTPCVSTDVGDAALIVGDTGWVVPAMNSEALASCIHQALQSKQDREAWQARQSKARRRVVEHFSLQRMISSYNEIWQIARLKPTTRQGILKK